MSQSLTLTQDSQKAHLQLIHQEYQSCKLTCSTLIKEQQARGRKYFTKLKLRIKNIARIKSKKSSATVSQALEKLMTKIPELLIQKYEERILEFATLLATQILRAELTQSKDSIRNRITLAITEFAPKLEVIQINPSDATSINHLIPDDIKIESADGIKPGAFRLLLSDGSLEFDAEEELRQLIRSLQCKA